MFFTQERGKKKGRFALRNDPRSLPIRSVSLVWRKLANVVIVHGSLRRAADVGNKMLPRALLGRSRQCSACLRASTSAHGSHDVETDTSKSQERFGKHEASEVAFSPTRLEDITHNYTRASDDAVATPVPAGHVGENSDAYNCGSNVNLYAHMQSNVPEPFEAEGTSPTSLNMPGGSGQSTSYMYLSGKRSSVK